MDRLRKAILSAVSEDMSLTGEMNDDHREIVDAFNALPDARPITDSDIEAMFE